MASFLNFDVGGRPYNSQDFAALQGIVIDTTQIYGAFTGNYIINGCTVRGGAGSIWLNGKIRAVEQDQVINNSTPFPLYLVEQNSQLNRLYRDGQSKVAFNVFSAIWSTTPPVSGQFITINSQSDLTTKTLKAQLSVDALPTSGGTFTGDITVIDSVRTLAPSNGLGTIMFASTSSPGNFQTGIGFNHTWNGSNYLNYGDGVNNASGAIVMNYSNGGAPVINFMVNPTSNGSDRFLSNVDVSNSIRMTLNSNGNLNVTGTVISNAVSTNGLTVNKVGTNSTITFPAQTNDPAYIIHYENNNSGAMLFSASDDYGTQDYFSFGGGGQEGVRIYTNGVSSFANTVSVQGNVNAADFIANGNSVTNLINSVSNTANSALSIANTANSTANAANSAASTAQSTANTAQSTANNANATANSALSTTATHTSQIADLYSKVIPTGVILMWSGAIGTIPSGWRICDGGGGTPDLRNRFIVGAGSSYSPGNTGGADAVTLTASQIPAHSHGYLKFKEVSNDWRGDGSNSPGNGTGNATLAATTDFNTGGGNSHENRPPYYALAYIMKT